MDATSHIESRLPSCHVTWIPARAPHRPAIVHAGGIAPDLFDGGEISETPYKIPDLKPAGQYVDKELLNSEITTPRRMRLLLDSGLGRAECRTVAAYRMAKNLPQVAWNQVDLNPDKDLVRPANRRATEADEPVGLRDVDSLYGGNATAIDTGRSSQDVELSDGDLEKCRAGWEPRGPAFGSGYLWTFALKVGPARHGAVIHPGEAVEKTCHADI
jgi:dihydroxyacid dehydratase/phosphogluconate dehydratase